MLCVHRKHDRSKPELDGERLEAIECDLDELGWFGSFIEYNIWVLSIIYLVETFMGQAILV